MNEIIILSIAFCATGAAAFFGYKYSRSIIQNKEKDEALAHKTRVIFAFKRLVENQGNLQRIFETIENAKTAEEFNEIYRNLFR